jgi:anthranilate synthase component 1
MVIKNGVAHVQAGGGIVADSKPGIEYQESPSRRKPTYGPEAAHEEERS